MELQNAEDHENEKVAEDSVVENDVDAENDEDEDVFEAEDGQDETEDMEDSAGEEESKEDEDKSVEASMDAKLEEESVPVEDDNTTEKETAVLGSVEASSSGIQKPKGLLAKKKVVKKVKRLVKRKVLKGSAVKVVAGEQNPSLGESKEEAIGAPAKNQPIKLMAGVKLRKTPQLERTVQENNNSLEGNEQTNGVEELNSVDVNATENNAGLAENKKRRKRRRGGKQVLESNKIQKQEMVGTASTGDVTQQRKEEKKDQVVATGNEKIGGLIFMCNSKTRPDCFRFSVMGVQEKRKDYVMNIKPGLKLFLYDYDLKLLYGIFEATSSGGMKLERNAFGGSFPAQVRFKVFSDCLPLPERKFKKAIKELYNNNNKFKTELSDNQVIKLKKLFRPAPIPTQLTNHTHTQPISAPRNVDRKRSDYASGSRSRRNPSPPPRREEPLPRPRDLYLSEREYRAYGLRRAEPAQHQIAPPESSYRDRVPLDHPYHPSVEHDRLLRHAEVDRHHHDRREVRLVQLPERDYRPYDHLSSRREILARVSPDPLPPSSTIGLDSYRRGGDPYYSYDYRAPERTLQRAPERPPRTYLASSAREDDDLYSQYVTADSLAEYYRSSTASRSRYPGVSESELLPSSVTSRYAYTSSLPYSHR